MRRERDPSERKNKRGKKGLVGDKANTFKQKGWRKMKLFEAREREESD